MKQSEHDIIHLVNETAVDMEITRILARLKRKEINFDKARVLICEVLEYKSLVEAKKRGRLPRSLFVRGMMLEDKIKRESTPSEAFCPECLSLARKPSRGCKNHNKLYEKAIKIYSQK